jgi:hypothetical protein
MRKRQAFIGVAFAVLLSGQSLEAGTAWDNDIISGRILEAAISGMERLISLVSRSSTLPLRADGEGGGTEKRAVVIAHSRHGSGSFRI